MGLQALRLLAYRAHTHTHTRSEAAAKAYAFVFRRETGTEREGVFNKKLKNGQAFPVRSRALTDSSPT